MSFTLGGCGTADAACKLGRLVELPVTMIDKKPVVTAKINGTDAAFVADSGAFYSMISAASAAELKLKSYPGPYGLKVMGVGGEADVSVARVKVFTLAGIPIPNVEFLVGGGEVGGGSVGVLGQNVFRLGDVEYDLANGIIRLMHEDDCGKANLAYWAFGTATPFSVIDIGWTSPQSPHTTGTAFINGVKVHVLFDTGANSSILSLNAAQRAGISVDAPGVKYAGYSRGIGRGNVKTWIAPIASFKIGDEEIRNTSLRIGESGIDSADMLIGADFFLSHRIYVASHQRRLFFTYNGGPVFNLSVLASATRLESAAQSDEPKNAAEFSRRGAAFAARRDFAHAIVDLTRACELAPLEPDYFYERGIAYRGDKQPIQALSDFDQAIQIRSDHVPALVARAEVRAAGGDTPHAIEDLDTADHAASKEADARLRMASVYASVDKLDAAKTQLDLWIGTHGADARLGDALAERCRIGALTGQNLSTALDDCNAALRLANKKDIESARAFSSRGLVRLRLTNYDKSVADFDAALKLNPSDAWALYGRGFDEMHRGKIAEGQADVAAAEALWPKIADAFARLGRTVGSGN